MIYNNFKYADIVTVIKVCVLEWFGHIVRMDCGKTVNTLLEGKPQGERKKGIPGLRWMDDGCLIGLGGM